MGDLSMVRLLNALANDCDETDGWQEAAPDVRKAADTIAALYNALFDAPLPSTMGSVETHYKLFYDWYNNVAQPALSLALGEKQGG